MITIEQLVCLRYNCLALAQHGNETNRSAEEVVAAARSYYDFATEIILVPVQVSANLDDEIPF